jgi:hypothetical protein
MPNAVKDRIAERLRPELEKVPTLSGDVVEKVVRGFTVMESSAPHSGHVQYRIEHVGPEIERRSDVNNAIERAIHAAGYYVAGEE